MRRRDWRPTLTLISPKKAWTDPKFDLTHMLLSSHMRVGFGRFGFHGFFPKLAWQKSMCSKWSSTEKCMHSHHTKQLRMNTINTVQLLYTVPGTGKLDESKQAAILSYPAGPNLHCHWPSTQDATTSFRLETVDGDQELERAVKRRYTLLHFLASMPQCLHDPWSGAGEKSGVDCIVECRPFVPEVDSVLDPPQSLAHWRWIMKLPSNRKCMQEDRCRSCTICCSLGSLLF